MHWTFSRLKDYETCPKRYEYKYLLRAAEPGPKSPALARGIEIHESIEHYLLAQTDTLDKRISKVWANAIANLRKLGASSEEQWEFDAGWNPLVAGEELWLRMKLDANYRYAHAPTVHSVIDFKTGKPYKANEEQNEVYAIGAFAKHDDVNEVVTALWYLDSEDGLHERTYYRKQVSKLARKWEGRASRMLDAEAFPAHAGRHCGWCPFRSICPDAE